MNIPSWLVALVLGIILSAFWNHLLAALVKEKPPLRTGAELLADSTLIASLVASLGCVCVFLGVVGA